MRIRTRLLYPIRTLILGIPKYLLIPIIFHLVSILSSFMLFEKKILLLHIIFNLLGSERH